MVEGIRSKVRVTGHQRYNNNLFRQIRDCQPSIIFSNVDRTGTRVDDAPSFQSHFSELI